MNQVILECLNEYVTHVADPSKKAVVTEAINIIKSGKEQALNLVQLLRTKFPDIPRLKINKIIQEAADDKNRRLEIREIANGLE